MTNDDIVAELKRRALARCVADATAAGSPIVDVEYSVNTKLVEGKLKYADATARVKTDHGKTHRYNVSVSFRTVNLSKSNNVRREKDETDA